MNVVIVLIQSFHYTIVSTTSDYHDLQRLHDLVQEKDSNVAKLNQKLQKKNETITILQKQVEQSYQQSKCTCVFMYIYIGSMDRYMDSVWMNGQMY